MKNFRIAFLVSFIFLLTCATGLSAQQLNRDYLRYIEKYKDLAIYEMKRFRIPASITLAQGLLESSAGNSRLARHSNNHFGIKCGGDWAGRTVRHSDDRENECFRAYSNPRESFEDHSKFLKSRPRYAFLFQLPITDYKGWAHGLRRAGYATNPSYANRLINLIEDYGLHRYDVTEGVQWMEEFPNPHTPYLANHLLYVIARQGDSMKRIAQEFGMSERKLIRYNDLYKGYQLKAGDIVYLDRKHARAMEPYVVHIVRAGDSMYSISQRYGIRLSSLYRLNKMKPDASAPRLGDILRLR